MLDYLRLSPMIGGGSLSLKANERERQRERERMTSYRFSVEKFYAVDAESYDEAVELLNSEKEYHYIVNEEWQLLGEEVSA